MKLSEQFAHQLQPEYVRKRPGMYVGSSSSVGVYNLIFGLTEELFSDNSYNEHYIKIKLSDNNVLLFECDHCIDTEDNFSFLVARALSSEFEYTYLNECIVYNKGELISRTPKIITNGNDTNRIVFSPDKEIFTYENIDYYRVFNQLKELAQLNSNVTFSLSNDSNKNILNYDCGLDAMLTESINNSYLQDKQPLNISFTKDSVNIYVSMIFGFGADVTLSFVNNIKTYDGGTHVQGLISGVFNTFKRYVIKHHGDDIQIRQKDVIGGLNFVLSVRLENPSFEGSTKRKLANKEIKSIINDGIIENLTSILETDQSFIDDSKVIQKAEIRKILSQ